jgi:protein-disulfide isomerase
VSPLLIAPRSIILASLLAALTFAQTPAHTPDTWQTAAEFPGLDQSGLSAQQKHVLLTLIRAEGCNCGCTFKIAECRVKDAKCGRSRNLATMVARELQEGKSPDTIRAELKRRMNEAPPLLDEAVSIPIDGAPSRGPANAKITLVEFSDFQCPYCAVAVASLNNILAKHSADVRLVFKQFPLDIHSQAAYAAEAALAAHAQGKFWPLHDKMYANFRNLSPDRINEWAKELGLDMVRFYMDMKSGKYKPIVEKELEQGEKAGVLGTPTVFINGKHYNGGVEAAALEEVIQSELKTVTARATASPRSQ